MTKSLWTEEEAILAAGMKRAGMTNKQIAARLGKTPSAVSAKTARIGATVSLRPGRRSGPYREASRIVAEGKESRRQVDLSLLGLDF